MKNNEEQQLTSIENERNNQNASTEMDINSKIENSSEIRIHIKICEAKELLKIKLFKKPDPYVTIHMKSQPEETKTTHFKSNTLNPVWDEEFDLITSNLNDTLLINMHHYMNDQKIMNEIEYQINELTVGGPALKKEISITFNNKNAGKFYFEVQAFRIPKSDIKPFCTFAATGEKFIDQKYYRCNTCGLTAKKSLGICEHCMKCCHKGHDVCLAFDADASVQSFCDCPGKCKCQCMPETNDLPCTAIETNGKPINQPMFYCNDCDESCELLICQNCAIKFHHGHQLVYLGIVESEICQNEEFNKE